MFIMHTCQSCVMRVSLQRAEVRNDDMPEYDESTMALIKGTAAVTYTYLRVGTITLVCLSVEMYDVQYTHVCVLSSVCCRFQKQTQRGKHLTRRTNSWAILKGKSGQ